MWGVKKLGLLIGLSLSMVALESVQAERLYFSNSVFPVPTCNSVKALGSLKTRLADRDLNIEWDGDLPWPDVLGVWTNTARDSYVVVGIKEFHNAPWGLANVTIRSICTDEVLAQGARIISNTDWERDYFYVRLRNYSLKGSKLIAQVKVASETCNVPGVKEQLEVRIVQQVDSSESSRKNILREIFNAERF